MMTASEVFLSFANYRWRANLARCRIKTWLITDEQAKQIAKATARNVVDELHRLAEIRAGEARMFGSPLKVKEPRYVQISGRGQRVATGE